MGIQHLPIAGCAFQCGCVVAHPWDDIAALLQLSSFVEGVEISREQSIAPFQTSQFPIQSVDVLDDGMPCHDLSPAVFGVFRALTRGAGAQNAP